MKMIASLVRNPEMKGSRRRKRERLCLLSGLIQLRRAAAALPSGGIAA
jgi:hypothetical protein